MIKIKRFCGKKIKTVRALLQEKKLYSFTEAIDFLKKNQFVSFDPTVELTFKLGIDVKKSDQVVRGVVGMPSGKGKSVRVAVICKDDRFDEAKASGADLFGNLDLIENIKKGVIKFDVCIATPDTMALVGQVAKVLGPKGLMPNPKLGTVTQNIVDAVRDAKAGQVEFRADKGGIVHAGVGKLSFTNDELLNNVKALFNAIVKSKPSTSKGLYIKAVFISSTMFPALEMRGDFLD